MKTNITNRIYRLEIAAPNAEDNGAFQDRLSRARNRLRVKGYDLDAALSDPVCIARADALKKIFERSRRFGRRSH